MSKASKMIHVSEDIFAGFKSTLRGGRILHKEYMQVGKGRDLGFNQLFLFEAKLASGAGEQALSREAYRLGRYLDLPRLLSFFYGSIGFYTTTAMVVVAVATLVFARMMLALTGIDENVAEFNAQFGKSVGLLQASSAYQLGILLILPMLAEIALEKTLVKAFTTYLWMLVTGQRSASEARASSSASAQIGRLKSIALSALLFLCFFLCYSFRRLVLLLLPHSNQGLLLQQFDHVRWRQVSCNGSRLRAESRFIHARVSNLRSFSHLPGDEAPVHDGGVRHLQRLGHQLVRGDVGAAAAGHRMALRTDVVQSNGIRSR